MEIVTAQPEERPAALELALCDLSADDRPTRLAHVLHMVEQRAIDPAGILVARDADNLRGVQICVPLAGAGGLCWLPKTRPADAALEDALVQRGLDWLRGSGAKIAQALLHPADSPGVAPLLRRGFRFVTRLNYLEHALARVPAHTSQRLSYSSYSAANRDMFHTILLRSYEGSRDCPELNGVRSIDEIIAGHMAQGNFRPERWWLACQGEEPIGVALATEVADLDAWDLSYLGVVPEARRRGFGREVALHVLQMAIESGIARITLAVDERNEPARQLYGAIGFETLDAREVYLYFWEGPLADKTPPLRSDAYM